MSKSACLSDHELRSLFVLLRSGLWEKDPDDLSLFPLSDAGWLNVYRESVRQTVTGLVYRGVCRLPDRFLPPRKLLFKWVACVDDIERQNARMNLVIRELYDQFASSGLKVVLQKGQGVAMFYDSPMLRECGDIDFYFPDRSDYDKTFQMLRKHQVALQRAADESFNYNWKGIRVEHHTRLFDLCRPSSRKWLKRMESEYGYVKENGVCDAGGIDVPSPVLNLILLNAHILKHVLGHGIGLRQLCDMARASYSLHDKVDGNLIREIYGRLGISRWSRLLYAFLVNDLGLPGDVSPYEVVDYKRDTLRRIILRGGNFGLHSGGRHADGRQGKWIRKYYTLVSHLRNMGFAMRYAPEEMFWTVWNLTKGQVGR